jgi:hypothetical protein
MQSPAVIVFAQVETVAAFPLAIVDVPVSATGAEAEILSVVVFGTSAACLSISTDIAPPFPLVSTISHPMIVPEKSSFGVLPLKPVVISAPPPSMVIPTLRKANFAKSSLSRYPPTDPVALGMDICTGLPINRLSPLSVNGKVVDNVPVENELPVLNLLQSAEDKYPSDNEVAAVIESVRFALRSPPPCKGSTVAITRAEGTSQEPPPTTVIGNPPAILPALPSVFTHCIQ